MFDNILSETICHFFFCAFSNNIMAKNWSDLDTISIANWIFGIDLRKKYFLLFFTDFKLLMFHKNIVKISEVELVQTLLPNYLPY